MTVCSTVLRRFAIIAAVSLSLQPTFVLAARGDFPCPDPYLDPRNDFCNPLRYISNTTISGIAFALVLAVGLIQTWLTYKRGAKYMLAMVIGCYTFALGIALRIGLHFQPQGTGLYIAEYLFVVLSPCAFIAATYVLLGRLAAFIDCDEYLIVRPRRITIAFVTSDIVTFLIQAAGGGVSASSRDLHTNEIGSHIFLAGLAAQLVSFIVFTIIFLLFLYRVYTRRQEIWNIDSNKAWYNDWRALGCALVISCIGILIRSVFRTIELSEGFAGPLATSEKLFYCLDTLPLFIAISVFIPFWPGRFIASTPITKQRSPQTSIELEDGKQPDGS
ncbi:RTA-like protein [Pleurotus pulmonarius]|nr:hypothetical protein EYR36_006392 [Pleurotus pulmonarius]KAF4601091.1 hypothetical protein EYR38_005741 [Pleurotus pulmonarius]